MSGEHSPEINPEVQRLQEQLAASNAMIEPLNSCLKAPTMRKATRPTIGPNRIETIRAVPTSRYSSSYEPMEAVPPMAIATRKKSASEIQGSDVGLRCITQTEMSRIGKQIAKHFSQRSARVGMVVPAVLRAMSVPKALPGSPAR